MLFRSLGVPWEDLPGRDWRLVELLGNGDFTRSGEALHGPGIYVELPAWGFHLLTCTPC